jgi:hypothetical protein
MYGSKYEEDKKEKAPKTQRLPGESDVDYKKRADLIKTKRYNAKLTPEQLEQKKKKIVNIKSRREMQKSTKTK